MIRLTLFLLILNSSCSFGQIQTPFPDSNALWTQILYTPDNPFDPWNQPEEYVFQYFPYLTDTIEGKEYTRLYIGADEQDYVLLLDSDGGDISWYDFTLTGHYRIDSNRVYFRSDHESVPFNNNYQSSYGFQTDEILLYDFNLQIGDTFQLTHVDQIRLESIDSIDIGGDYYRTFHFEFLTNIALPDEYYWIEGVGSTIGFFSYFRFFEQYLCFDRFDEYEFNYYYQPTVGFCNYNGLEESTSNFQFFPNPTADRVSITCSSGYPVNGFLTDINGEFIENLTINSTNYELDLSHLMTGIYIISLGSEKHRIVKM